jgi:hypothetical protein
MPLYRLLQEASFSPERTAAMSAAFEEVCARLRLARRDDPLRDLVARKVIAAARMGVADAAGIRNHVLEAFKGYAPKPNNGHLKG